MGALTTVSIGLVVMSTTLTSSTMMLRQGGLRLSFTGLGSSFPVLAFDLRLPCFQAAGIVDSFGSWEDCLSTFFRRVGLFEARKC